MRQVVRRRQVPALAAFVLVIGWSVAALAQTGRVGGTVKDESGQPIKGATVTADNPQASPSTFNAVTDDKGRFSMIGLKAGVWTFTASAQGFAPSQGSTRIQTLGINPPVEFKLAKGAAGPAGALAGVNTKDLQAELQAADALYNTGQYDAAIAAYQAIMAKAPVLTIINLQVGNAHRMKKEYDKALAAYQEVLKADPANERAKVAIGMTNLERGDLAAAETTLIAAAESATASREVFYNLGEVKFAKGEADEAAKWFQKAVDADPTWGKPVFKLGLVALNKGDKEGAIKQFEKVIQVDPNSPEAAQSKTVVEQLKKS
jgi:tetratricopeptide (TPR) repeat protein